MSKQVMFEPTMSKQTILDRSYPNKLCSGRLCPHRLSSPIKAIWLS